MLKVNELYKIADGLNIEGGFPGQQIKKSNKENKWANLVVVLDRPLIDNITFDEILMKNTPLLENAIYEINEHKLFAIYLLVILYYIETFPDSSIVVHVHQDTLNGIPTVELIEKHLKGFTKRNYSNIKYMTDIKSFIESTYDYKNATILISLSQSAGLNPEIGAGEILLPDSFVPYDADKHVITTTQEYQVENDLIKSIGDVLKYIHIKELMEYINNNYVSSASSKKSSLVDQITPNDFRQCKILQVSGLWNPKNKDEIVEII